MVIIDTFKYHLYWKRRKKVGYIGFLRHPSAFYVVTRPKGNIGFLTRKENGNNET